MFQKIFKANLFIIFLLILAGCSSSPASLDRNHLKTNKISAVSLSSPNKLSYEISTSGTSGAAAGFGLIGGLVGASIDAVIDSKRAKGMIPIVAALGNYNTRLIFSEKLKRLSGISFKNGLAVNSSSKVTKPATNVLGVQASYTLSPNHQFITVNSSTTLKTSEKAESYVRNFTARSKIDFNLVGDQKINATQYLIDNPNKVKSAIGAAMDSIVKQIAVDINVGVVKK